ncbi:hypothetical protein E2P81_ATG01057 [Venturia nashicola]|uniref:Pyrimidine 5-nucleotidase n=1 Tax=Venturia nashicola TaxID=86259 RepID=A0A4Z1PFX7_9PEZI|nr:hypothetical protein E6O75_ATG01077 [Venturia nashicola]TLD38514.1 hypothetical protein E2P81_ATG01057 [Venturia nashicola]
MPDSADNRPVFFFDIDNCEFVILKLVLPTRKLTKSTGTRIQNIMAELIDKYFQTHLSLPAHEATALHMKYYQSYGLAIEGLVRHHEVDALDFNSKVDDAIPLENILSSNPSLQAFLASFDKTKVKLWLLTNAHVTHGKRVVRLLGVEDFFEGITYCDYAEAETKGRLLAKPERGMWEKAMREAGVEKVDDCYFVDDSYINAKGATQMGWKAIHFVEKELDLPEPPASQYRIRELEEIRNLFPQFFKDA